MGLAIAIAILLPLLANMTVRIFAEPPDYSSVYETYPPKPKTEEERKSENAIAKAKQDKYEQEMAVFNLKAFYVAFPLGLLEIFVGVMVRRKTTVASGLLFGGLFTTAFGTFSSWETLPGIWRYASLLFVLVFLGLLGLAVDRSIPPKVVDVSDNPPTEG